MIIRFDEFEVSYMIKVINLLGYDNWMIINNKYKVSWNIDYENLKWFSLVRVAPIK